MVPEPAGADIVLVNTCGFIEAAKAESLETILEIARLKEQGSVKKLVVAGCLSQRYPEELAKELPEVDLFIGTGEVPRVAEILREHEANEARRQYIGIPSYLYDHATPRLRTTPSHSAFLKVSEGCDHKCAFCIIPQLRGPHRSRPIDSVVKEAAMLAQDGVKEINLIAQDLTAYGRERKDGTTLFGLLREMVSHSRHRLDPIALCLSELPRRTIAGTHPGQRENLQVHRHPFSTCQSRAYCKACAGEKAAAPCVKRWRNFARLFRDSRCGPL